MYDITDADLDVLLHIDSPPLTLRSTTNDEQENERNCSIFNFNREPFPSQFDTQLNRLSQQSILPNTQALDLTLPLNEYVNSDNSSLIMTTQEMEEIILNETELPQMDEVVEATQQNVLQPSQQSSSYIKFPAARLKLKELDLSTVQGTLSTPSFDEEFAKFQAIELPPDIDFEQLDFLEQSHYRRDDTTTPLKSANVSKSQDNYTKNVKITKNMPNTCPVPRRVSTSIDSSGGSKENPINFLQLNYGHSTQDSAHLNMSAIPDTIHSHNVLSKDPKPVHTQPLDLSHCSEELEPDSGEELQTENNIFKLPPTGANTISDINMCDGSARNISTNSSSFQFNMAENSVADATMIPSSVRQLHNLIKTQYTDFAFVYALSAQLCQERVPMDCFVNLKMGLLLSLASIGQNPHSPPIPIIGIGNDSHMFNYLMTNIGQLAERFIGPTDDVKPPSSNGYRNHNWIEADPILLAKGGVFFVGDWSRLKLARADKLFKDIECSRIAIEKSTQVYPLETAIWAHQRTFKTSAKDQQTFNKFVKIFGIPICMDDSNHEVLVNYILEQSSVRLFDSTVDHLSISSDDMRCFLAVISKRTVDLSPEASALLQKYFVVSRIDRPDCLTQQAFAVLKQFAESFAKLSFRHEVLTIDAVAAIYMCEHFIYNIFGAGGNPPPSFESHNFVGSVDGHMNKFQQWLQAYIEKFYDKP